MKAQLLMLSAVGLLVAASSSHAATAPELQAFLDRAQAQAENRLDVAGVDLKGQPVAVRGSVDSEGKLRAIHVVRSTGSRDTDFAVEKALKRMSVANVPPLLVGGEVTLALGGPPIVQAKAP
jgi:TonB family protein